MAPGFDSPLYVELADGGRGTHQCWRLTAPLTFRSWRLGRVFTVPKGFETDFGSVPRWLPLAYALVGNIAEEPATLHDWLYTTHAVTRREADGILYEAMRSIRVARWRCAAWWVAVRAFGWSHWRD